MGHVLGGLMVGAALLTLVGFVIYMLATEGGGPYSTGWRMRQRQRELEREREKEERR